MNLDHRQKLLQVARQVSQQVTLYGCRCKNISEELCMCPGRCLGKRLASILASVSAGLAEGVSAEMSR